MTWRASALCAQIDPDIWWPEQGANKHARALCARCSVVAPCLADSLAAKANPSGVWGGTSYRERAAMRAVA